MVRKSRRYRQNLGIIVGLLAGLAVLYLVLFTRWEQLTAHGPMNTGHEDLRCEACHRAAPGTLRQQIQANARYLLGLRQKPADFGKKKVDNEICLDCHRRPDDRHPVFRFLEPRFQEVRREIAPHRCLSCHLEHQAKRVTLSEIDFCRHCHEETKLKKDPVSPSHEILVQGKRWRTCLGCHDFHGNHRQKPPTELANAFSKAEIIDYFEGGSSPYGEEKQFLTQRRKAYEY